jgi:hypothetical protein
MVDRSNGSGIKMSASDANTAPPATANANANVPGHIASATTRPIGSGAGTLSGSPATLIHGHRVLTPRDDLAR